MSRELENAIKWCEKQEHKAEINSEYSDNSFERGVWRGRSMAHANTADYLRSVLRRQKQKGNK